MSFQAGHPIGERYQLTQQIAVGGMGEVWKASDARLGRVVAIKLLKSEFSVDPEFVERFRVEARTAASLNHRNVAAVHDYGEDAAADGAQTAYLVMELVYGEPLSSRLDNHGRQDPVFTLDLLEQAGHALAAAHARGFVHRDVKPGNILLAADGTVKLTDFGIAAAINSSGLTASGMVLGTVHYMAPEQARGEVSGPASDVYGLGVVGYECLAGYRPYRGTDPAEVALMHVTDEMPELPTDVPTGVRELIEYAMTKDPEKRYPDGAVFVAAVAEVRRGRPAPHPLSGAMRRIASSTSDSARRASASATPATDPAVAEPTSGESPGQSPDKQSPSAQTPGAAAASSPPAPPVPAVPANLSHSGAPPLPGPGIAWPRPPQPRQPWPAQHGQPTPQVWPARPPTPRPPPPPNAFGAKDRSGPSPLTWAFILLTLAAVAVGVIVVLKALRTSEPAVAPAPSSLSDLSDHIEPAAPYALGKTTVTELTAAGIPSLGPTAPAPRAGP